MDISALTYPKPPKHRCETCLHYCGNQECYAFYGKIPADIWNNKKKHNKVLDDQLLPYVYELGYPIL